MSWTLPRVRDRSGYEVGQDGCMNAYVAATGGSRSSYAVNAHHDLLNKNVERDLSASIETGCIAKLEDEYRTVKV